MSDMRGHIGETCIDTWFDIVEVFDMPNITVFLVEQI
jgi:hypothetical protein